MRDYDRRTVCPQVLFSKLRNAFRLSFIFDTCSEDCQVKFKSEIAIFLTVQNQCMSHLRTYVCTRYMINLPMYRFNEFCSPLIFPLLHSVYIYIYSNVICVSSGRHERAENTEEKF
jgi:hypothetical protein